MSYRRESVKRMLIGEGVYKKRAYKSGSKKGLTRTVLEVGLINKGL